MSLSITLRKRDNVPRLFAKHKMMSAAERNFWLKNWKSVIVALRFVNVQLFNWSLY